MLDDTREIFYNTLFGRFIPVPSPTRSFAGQTVIVTGANTGLGLEAARHIARLKVERLILAVRTVSKGDAAKASIERSSDRTDFIDVWELDLARYESVMRFAERANRDLLRLDCLLSNAGVSMPDHVVAEENESTVTINVVSTFLLGILVLPLARRTAAEYKTHPRLSFVGSDVHFLTSFPVRDAPNIFEKVNSQTSASDMRFRYIISKTMDVLLAKELAERLEAPLADSGVIVNYSTPGLCRSELGRNLSGFEGTIARIMFFRLLGRHPEIGSRAIVAGAAGTRETHGQYMSDGRVSQPSTFMRSEAGKKTRIKLFNELMEKLEKISPGISKLIES